MSERDDFILALIREGKKREATSFLVEKYQNMVVGFCVNMMPQNEEHRGLDIAQEAFVAFYEGIDKFHGEASIRTWLFAIVRNLCLTERRIIAREKRRRAEENRQSKREEKQPRRANTLDERLTLLEQALNMVPPGIRTLLRIVTNHGAPAAADAFGIPVATVYQRYRRGRLQVKKTLADLERNGIGDD